MRWEQHWLHMSSAFQPIESKLEVVLNNWVIRQDSSLPCSFVQSKMPHLHYQAQRDLLTEGEKRFLHTVRKKHTKPVIYQSSFKEQ